MDNNLRSYLKHTIKCEIQRLTNDLFILELLVLDIHEPTVSHEFYKYISLVKETITRLEDFLRGNHDEWKLMFL